jgi:hypothetical protein
MYRYIHFINLKHLIFPNGGSTCSYRRGTPQRLQLATHQIVKKPIPHPRRRSEGIWWSGTRGERQMFVDSSDGSSHATIVSRCKGKTCLARLHPQRRLAIDAGRDDRPPRTEQFGHFVADLQHLTWLQCSRNCMGHSYLPSRMYSCSSKQF